MKNKLKIFFSLMLISIFGISVSAQTTEVQIAKIRAAVAVIDKNVPKYKKIKKDVEGFSLEGTEAVFYSSGTTLKKITAKAYSEGSNSTDEIYYDGNMPIFIYEKLNKYDRPLNSGGRTPKVVKVEETRVYYVNNQIIRILVGTKEIKPTDEKYEELKKEFTGYSDALLEAYKK